MAKTAIASRASNGRVKPAGFPLNRISDLFFYLAVVTVSFDIFLIVETGFTVRLSQILWLLPFFTALFVIARKGSFRKPLGFELLTLWTAFILIFLPNSQLYSRGIAYALLLVYYLVLILATVQLFQSFERIVRLLRWYLFSFLVVGAFGIVQFVLPLLGVSAPLIQQWWIPGLLARVNGFSYEPSYFATYMLTGWVFIAWLLQSRSQILMPRTALYLLFGVVSLALVLSSSRMGLVMMALYYFHYPIIVMGRFLRAKINWRHLSYTAIGVTTAGLVLFLVLTTGSGRLLLAGTGVAGTPSHSTSIRTAELRDTVAVFRKSPLIGYSLGGVAPAIGELRGNEVATLAAATRNEGMSVFAEVLAASGIVGFLPFMAYMALLIYKPLQLARKIRDPEKQLLLRGLVVSLFFLLLILQMNQNILRPYFWLHIAILSAFYVVAKRSHREAQA